MNSPPLSQRTSVLGWLKQNLFATPLDSIITVVSSLILIMLLPPLFEWLLFDADFIGSTKDDCDLNGACWVFIKERLVQITYGFYPYEELWRVNLSFLVVGIGIFASLTGRLGSQSIWLALTSTVIPIGAWFVLRGDILGFSEVETAKWGGLMVTLIISFVGISFSLPLGVALALARRSSLPILRLLSTIFIESWRGVPLITVLFMSSVLFPIFLPPDWQMDKLLRALFGVLFFASAYMAEVVRGGLQAIPKGQEEAANALALSYFQKQRYIVLPQALKYVIPGITNVFISLLKDTTLVSIISMYDLLGIVQSANSDPEWPGLATEGYVFVGLIFWIICFGLSRYSMSIEKKQNLKPR
ncbi:MAG: amino acid ABC transporter permease [Proteobacteria bacterium]|nr:amino acid ABC transporter permease [Pseudomonadota bacterium]